MKLSILFSFMVLFICFINHVHAIDLGSDDAAWNPGNTERFVRLPSNYMKKSVDYDFEQSSLGQVLRETENNIQLKGNTLSDIHQSINQTNDNNAQIELRHQLLSEKKAYINLLESKNELKRKKLNTKINLYEKILKKKNTQESNSPEIVQLIEKQSQAKERFEKGSNNMDIYLLNKTSSTESKYAKKYSENMQAIEKLMSRITSHEANQQEYDEMNSTITKEEYVRKIIADAQAELALIEQEESILAYMSKIVALDALALSEKLMDSELASNKLSAKASVAENVDVFLSN